MNLCVNLSDIDSEKYFIATYEVKTNTDLMDVAWNIAIGQSVGNPSIRNSWESEDLFRNHSCLILGEEAELRKLTEGIVKIAFPLANIDFEQDGINHLLCQLLGGQVDIDIIHRCRLIDVKFPTSVENYFLGPKFGITGLRNFTGSYNKPLLGGIVKPKTGLSPEKLLDLVKAMVDGGVDFIKEDEIMSNPAFCRLEKRVDLIANYLAKQSKKVIFCHTINTDPHLILERVRTVHNLGGNGVHINVWGSFGVYNSVRRLDLPIAMHLQSSGAKVFTDVYNRYSVSWPVLCYFATLMGVDTIQTGMIGGYSNDDPQEILSCLNVLRKGNTLPALSCGFHPGLVGKVNSLVGIDYLANSGGAIHGHPGGTTSGARAMRQAIDNTHSTEYWQAIEKWGTS